MIRRPVGPVLDIEACWEVEVGRRASSPVLPSSHWLKVKAVQRGRGTELEEGRRAFRRGDACPQERWRKLGWQDASTQALRGQRLAPVI